MSNVPEHDDVPGDEVIAELYCHFIFWSPKLRPVLPRETLATVREDLDQAMFTIDGEALAAGGSENHLHILARLSPDHTLDEAIETLRERSATWVAGTSGMDSFHWSESCVAVSVSPEDLGRARESIENQESHHEIVSFECEIKAICDEHGFELEQRDLWG
jgi:REP element-mobilizing transposase RayT